MRKRETLSRIQYLFLTPSLLYCSLKPIEDSAEVSTNPRPMSVMPFFRNICNKIYVTYIYIYIYIYI